MPAERTLRPERTRDWSGERKPATFLAPLAVVLAMPERSWLETQLDVPAPFLALVYDEALEQEPPHNNKQHPVG